MGWGGNRQGKSVGEFRQPPLFVFHQSDRQLSPRKPHEVRRAQPEHRVVPTLGEKPDIEIGQ